MRFARKQGRRGHLCFGILPLSPVVHHGKPQPVTGKAPLTRLPRQCGPAYTPYTLQPSSLAVPYNVSEIFLAIPLSPRNFLCFVLWFLSRPPHPPVCFSSVWLQVTFYHPQAPSMLTGRAWAWTSINTPLFPFTCLTRFSLSVRSLLGSDSR